MEWWLGRNYYLGQQWLALIAKGFYKPCSFGRNHSSMIMIACSSYPLFFKKWAFFPLCSSDSSLCVSLFSSMLIIYLSISSFKLSILGLSTTSNLFSVLSPAMSGILPLHSSALQLAHRFECATPQVQLADDHMKSGAAFLIGFSFTEHSTHLLSRSKSM